MGVSFRRTQVAVEAVIVLDAGPTEAGGMHTRPLVAGRNPRRICSELATGP